jgi:hypothetical protein
MVPEKVNRRSLLLFLLSVEEMGAPGLAFETWDPWNQSQMETPWP